MKRTKRELEAAVATARESLALIANAAKDGIGRGVHGGAVKWREALDRVVQLAASGLKGTL